MPVLSAPFRGESLQILDNKSALLCVPTPPLPSLMLSLSSSLTSRLPFFFVFFFLRRRLLSREASFCIRTPAGNVHVDALCALTTSEQGAESVFSLKRGIYHFAAFPFHPLFLFLSPPCLPLSLSLSRTASLVVFLFLFSSSSSILSPSSASPLIFDPESKRGQRQACRSLRPYF